MTCARRKTGSETAGLFSHKWKEEESMCALIHICLCYVMQNIQIPNRCVASKHFIWLQKREIIPPCVLTPGKFADHWPVSDKYDTGQFL